MDIIQILYCEETNWSPPAFPLLQTERASFQAFHLPSSDLGHSGTNKFE